MIRLTNVEKTYDNGTHALNGISFEIQDGEFVFLVGVGGSLTAIRKFLRV